MRLPGHRIYHLTIPDTNAFRDRLVTAMLKTGALVSLLSLGNDMDCRLSILPTRLQQFRTILSPLGTITVEAWGVTAPDAADPGRGG